MHRFVLVFVIASAALCCAATASAAEPAAWPLAAPAATLCGYGAMWASGNGSTHKGVDLEAQAGADVLAPCDATVAFAGTIPGQGRRVGCVTLSTADGTKVTLMPLEEVRVKTGQSVSVGDAAGTLSESGDASSAQTHLHVSLRRGETYLDPMTMLAAPLPAVADPPVSEPEPDPAPSAAPAAHAAATAPVYASGAAVTDGARTTATGSSGVTVADPAAFAASQHANHVTSGVTAIRAASAPAAAPVPQPGVAPTHATRGATRPQPAPTPLSPLVDAVLALARRALRLGGLSVLALLAAVGCLWPLWRSRDAGESSDVTPTRDDVAAAVGRW